jgi:hypothetical protein
MQGGKRTFPPNIRRYKEERDPAFLASGDIRRKRDDSF